MLHPLILLFGGESHERLVSVASAQNMAKALTKPICWFWHKNEKVFEVSIEELCEHKNPYLAEFKPKGKAKWDTLKEALATPDVKDSVFVLGLHGGRGEDGTVQKWLEAEKLAFTGSDSKSCHLTFEKDKALEVIRKLRIKTAEHVIVQGSELVKAEKDLKDFLATHKKIALKPVASGSSFGFLVIENDTGLNKALEQFKANPNKSFLAEAFIEGTEISIGVTEQDGHLIALPCTEIRKQKDRIFDYKGKYLGDGIQEITPAPISESNFQMAQRVALLAHEAFECRGYSRTDLIFQENVPVFLETNTLPGLAAASIIPQELGIKSISMRTFLISQIEIAVKAAHDHN